VPSAELLFPVLALADPVRGRFAGGGIGWGKDCSDITVVVPLARFIHSEERRRAMFYEHMYVLLMVVTLVPR
jgi:hypothetical protein